MVIRRSRRPVGSSPDATRRSLLTGATAGIVTAAGALAAGLSVPASAAAAATTPTPDWHNVVTYGADPSGKQDSRAAFQRAIAALPKSLGGVVYVPAGTYKISSGPLQPVSGLRLTGDGALCTIITSVTNGLINANTGSQLDSVEIDHLTLETTGSHLIAGAWVVRWRIHDCRLIQNSADRAIWNASVVGMAECMFDNNTEYVYGATRTIDAWYLSAGSDDPQANPQINQTTWRDNICFNQGDGMAPYDNSHYWYHLLQTAAGNVNQANSFVNIVFEHCCGGAIVVESALGTLIDNCWSYDTPAATIASPMFRIKSNTTGGIPQLTTIRNSGRLGAGLISGVVDIALASTCVNTTISGCGCNEGNQPFFIDLGGASSVTLSGLPKSCTLLNTSALPFIGQLPGSAPQPEDLDFAGWAYDCAAASGTGTALTTAGMIYLIKVPVRVAKPITNIRVNMTAAGSGLTSGSFAGVYNSLGTQLGISADQSSAWLGSPGVIDAPLTDPVTVGPGFVWVALLFNGTTGPTIDGQVGSTAVMANGRLAATSARFGSVLKNQAALPQFITLADISPSVIQWWAAIW